MADREKVQEIVRQLNIIDDTFFQKMAEDIGFCEEMISTILGQKVKVKRVVPQNSIKNLQGRSVVLDALCTLENGEDCNVEVQKADDDNHVRRVRYNTSCITANITEPGTKFEKVPDVIGIYISKFDVFKSGKTVYHIDRVIRETGEVQDNGLQEIYVNTKIDDGSDIAELMRIFKENDAYDFEKFPKVSGRKRQFKASEGGNETMCDLVENYAKQKAAEAEKKAIAAEAKASALRFFQNGASYELVRTSIISLSDEELQAIYEEAKKNK
ncbi:MAG: PD-(D/E)XK nuclease family transposase [Tyzzerella sp.]|nr:PD-(D/E)XK nuclease family transposase [Tyzzerella sp.]